MQANTSNITYSNTSHNEASKALATLGSGNITVGGVQLEEDGELTEAGQAGGSPLAALNRDTQSTTKELWNVDRQEGNVDLAIDHRMLSESGRKEIKEDFVDTKDFGQDIAYSTQEVHDSEHLGVTDFWTTLDNTAKGTQLKHELIRNPENAHILQGLKSGDGEQYAQAMADLGHLAQKKFGIELTDVNLYDASITDSLSLENNLIYDTKGGIVTEQGHDQYGDIFVNAQEGETKTGMVGTLGHEVIESHTLQTGGNNDDAQEAQANIFGNHFANRIDQAAGGDLDNTGGSSFSSNLANSQAVYQGTQQANNVGSATVDHRQLRAPEMEAISLAAKRMAIEEGISEQRAEQRLAAELLDHLDSSWNAKHQEEGRETDTVALDYLAESLADVGGFYEPLPDSDIPVAPEDKPIYTAGEVKEWLQGYSTNHENTYENRTLNAEDLRNSFSEMTQFYDRNLREDKGMLDALAEGTGEMAAAGKTVLDIGRAGYMLADEPIASGKAIFNETARMIIDAGNYVSEIKDNKHQAEMNSALDAYQGDFFSAGYSDTKGDLDLGMEILGALPVPVGKIGVLKNLDNATPDINPNLLADPSYGVRTADVADIYQIEGIIVKTPGAAEPITDPAHLLEYNPSASTGKPDFYVGAKGPEATLPATGYRYGRYLNDDGTVDKYVEETLTTKKAPGSYIGFDNFSTGREARDAFQIRGPDHVGSNGADPSWSDARLKGTFDTLQLFHDGKPNVRVPLEKGDTGPNLEPITTAYPEYGEGGRPQLKTDDVVELEQVDILPEE